MGSIQTVDKLDMRKEIVLDMKKKLNLDGVKAQVILCLDFSGSMSSLYSSGKVQELTERLLPLGLAFDDNGEVDFYLFHDGVIKVSETLTRANLNGYINSKVLGKYSMGGTNYAPIINQVVEDYAGAAKRQGLFGKKVQEEKKFDMPVYVIFITDGENGDKSAAEEAIKNASRFGIFFQFVGIGGAQFTFLQKLDNLSGRVIDNANFFKVDDLSRKTDEELYQLLLTEFPSWIPQARAANQIV